MSVSTIVSLELRKSWYRRHVFLHSLPLYVCGIGLAISRPLRLFLLCLNIPRLVYQYILTLVIRVKFMDRSSFR